MTPLQQYTAPVLRRWPLVLVIAVLGALIAGLWSITSAATAWTATAALSTQSQNRSPEQDAVLALGYVDFFNQDSYQQLLRDRVEIPEDVELVARTGASSPILYIEATAGTEDDARAAATVAAEGFRDDVRDSLIEERTREVADLQAQVDVLVDELQTPGTNEAEDGVVLDQVRSLQGRITDISSDATNQLKQLQPVPGVSSSVPSPAVDVLVGALGGGVLGVLVALLLGVTDVRVRTASDLGRLGLTTLADLDDCGDAGMRARRIGNLVNSLSLVGRSGPVIVAVVAPHGAATSSAFARELAAAARSRRAGALLVRADLRGSGAVGNGRRGLVEVLVRRADAQRLVIVEPDGLRVLPPGNLAGRDPNVVLEPDRFVEFVGEAGAAAGFVVLDAASICDAPESQVVCAVADHVILVVERAGTRHAQVREAQQRLSEVHAGIAGVVIDTRREPLDGLVEDPGPPTERIEAVPVARIGTVPVARVGAGVLAGAARNGGGPAGPGASGGAVDRSSGVRGPAPRDVGGPVVEAPAPAVAAGGSSGTSPDGPLSDALSPDATAADAPSSDAAATDEGPDAAEAGRAGAEGAEGSVRSAVDGTGPGEPSAGQQVRPVRPRPSPRGD